MDGDAVNDASPGSSSVEAPMLLPQGWLSNRTIANGIGQPPNGGARTMMPPRKCSCWRPVNLQNSTVGQISFATR
jgi:hypothetical protein